MTKSSEIMAAGSKYPFYSQPSETSASEGFPYAEELPQIPIKREHWFRYGLWKGWEFLLHHFFVLSGSTRIFLIASFLVFGGTFYAVGTTTAAGIAFFAGSIAISLVLASVAHHINEDEDGAAIRQQREAIAKLTWHQATDGGALERAKAGVQEARAENKNDKAAKHLHYRSTIRNTIYAVVIYLTDLVIVVAAVWNIADETLRWKAFLPIHSLIAAAGSTWTLVVIGILAAISFYYKNRYTRQIIALRQHNDVLVTALQTKCRYMIAQNNTLEVMVGAIRAKFEENPGRKKILEDASEQIEQPGRFVRGVLSGWGAFLGSFLLAGLCGGLIFRFLPMLWPAPLSVVDTLWAAVGGGAVIWGVLGGLWYVGVRASREYERGCITDRTAAVGERTSIIDEILRGEDQEQKQVVTSAANEAPEEAPASEEKVLAELAYDIVKMEDAQDYTPRRGSIGYLVDQHGARLWNTAITIFPILYLMNALITSGFGISSSVPLFVIELLISVPCAYYFGLLKEADSAHDQHATGALQLGKKVHAGLNTYVTQARGDLADFGLSVAEAGANLGPEVTGGYNLGWTTAAPFPGRGPDWDASTLMIESCRLASVR